MRVREKRREGKEEDPTAALKRNEDDSAKLEGGSGAGMKTVH